MYSLEKTKRGYFCEELKGSITDDVQTRLYKINEKRSDATPYCTIHDEEELPGYDVEPEDLTEWEQTAKAACDEYLKDGGQYPFYLIENPGRLPGDTFECWDNDATDNCWRTLLDEWTEDCWVSYFEAADAARLIDEAIQEGNDEKAAAIIDGVFLLFGDHVQNFLDVLKAATGVYGELRELIENDNGETDSVFYAADMKGDYFCNHIDELKDENDEEGVERIIQGIEKKLAEAIREIDAKYHTNLEVFFF